jgi:predicted nucleic acid-binding protein
MKKYRAIIDTNVLHAGLYSSLGASYEVLRLIELSQIVPLLSTALLFEYEEILRRNKDMLGLSNPAIEDILDGLC